MGPRKPETALRSWLQGHVGLRIAELSSDSSMGHQGEQGSHEKTADPSGKVRLRLLGAPQLLTGGAGTYVLERRDAALLALLAIEGPMPRNRAAALLWADLEPKQARGNLRQRLFRLRAVGDVVTTDDVLRIAPKVEHDLVPIAPRLLEDPATGAGELLGELDYSDCPALADWVAVAREQWRRQRIHALAEIAARFETEQKIAAALPYAERLIADDPTLEHAHRRLMRLHYLRGDRAAALAAFERCRQLLRLELGTPPGAETLELFRLIEHSGALPQAVRVPTPLALLRPPRLVGRDAEWARIDAALAQRVAVVVLGEPGIGKSRLLGDMAAQRGGVLVGGRPGDSRVPYATLSRLLRALLERHLLRLSDALRRELAGLLPELGNAGAGPLDHGALQRAVSSLVSLTRAAGTGLLVLDDLHFADEATLEALPALVADQASQIAWLLAVRANEVPATLAPWLRAQDIDRVREIVLRPLDETAVGTLLETLAIPGLDSRAWAGPLTRHTGGNPLFILETLRAQTDKGFGAWSAPQALPAPVNVGQLIEGRLQQLSPRALKLARVAAIAGQDFGPELAAHVLQQQPLDLADAWHELEAAQVIRDNAFAHDLIHQGVQRSVPEAIARVLHAQIAQYLEPTNAEPAQVAAHWEASGQWRRAGEAYVAAAERSRRLSLRKLESEWLSRAAQNFERAGCDDEQFMALFQLVQVSRIVDPHQVVRVHATRLLNLATNDAQRALAYESMALVLNDAFEFVPALDAIGKLRSLPPGALAAQRVVSVARIEGVALCQVNRHREAIELLQPLAAAAMEKPQGGENAGLLCDFSTALIACDKSAQAHRVLQAARDVALAAHDASTLYHVHTNLAWCTYCLGQLIDSTEHYEQARRIYAKLGNDRPPQTKHEMGLARQYRELGRYAEALALIEATVSEQSAGNNAALLTISTVEQSALYVVLGQSVKARQVLVAPSGAVAGSIRGAHLFALARIAQLERRKFRPLIEEAIECVTEEGRPFYTLLLQLELCAALGPSEAAALALKIGAQSEQLDLQCLALPSKAIAASALLAAGEVVHATQLAGKLSALLETSAPIGLYAPRYWWIISQVFAEAGDAGSAHIALERARRWILDQALPCVPAAYRDSFLHRNPVNRDVLTGAAARPD
jgi:DNA-binding SARP family transcriptional activator/tetratricopeptide (TPR) repeat protein